MTSRTPPESTKGFHLDALNVKYSDDAATSVLDSVAFERCLSRPAGDILRPSVTREVSQFREADIEFAARKTRCESTRRRVSDRLRVSIRAKEATGPGDFWLTVWSKDSFGIKVVFDGRFNFDNELGVDGSLIHAWLVTISGEPTHEWIVGLSYEQAVGAPPQQSGGTQLSAEIQVSAICDRGGALSEGALGDGAVAGVVANTEAIVSTTVPEPAQDYAVEHTVSASGYAALPDVAVGFRPDQASFAFSTTVAGEVWVSFDGVTDHVHMVNGAPTGSWTFPTHRREFWLRTSTPGTTIQALVTTTRRF